MLVKIYTDGAARGNPDGPGGYGTVLEYLDTKGQLHKKELSQGFLLFLILSSLYLKKHERKTSTCSFLC